MTTRQLYEQSIDQRQALEKAGLMAAFDAAGGEPVKVDGRKRRGRKPKQQSPEPPTLPMAAESGAA